MTERERRTRIIEHLKAGDAQQAAEEFAASREAYPGDEVLHHAIGLAFASNGALSAAREHLEAAARLTPDSAMILADLAQVYLALGKADEAIESAENAVDMDRSLPIARFTLGRACLAVESSRQARHSAHVAAGFNFPLIDGRSPLYLRALTEMETALSASPSFAPAVRAALAFAYLRAGHYHAARGQLQAQLTELPPGEESDRVSERLRCVEYEIARERYWADLAELNPATAPAGDTGDPEWRLRRAHACAAAGRDEALAAMLAEARSAGYEPRPALISRFDLRDQAYREVSDVHLFIAAGLECVLDGDLRFLPFDRLRSVELGPPAHWRTVRVELTSGETVDAAVPSLYRLSLRSPNDLIQSGRFTQFKYGPGETRYARAVGSRNLATEDSVIPFTDVRAITFMPL